MAVAPRRRSTPAMATSGSRIRSSAIAGPICCSFPAGMFPIDLLWDEPDSRGSPSPARVVQPADLDRPSSEPAARTRCRSTNVRHCSRGPTGSSPCSTRSGANARRSSRCREPRCRSCCWLPAILDRVRSLVLWSPYARFLRAADYPVGIPETPRRPLRRPHRRDDGDRRARRHVGAELGGRCRQATVVGAW